MNTGVGMNAGETGAASGSAGEGLSSLYVTYDGVLEPLGQSQVLPYVRGLAARGVRMHVLSFEKPQDLKNGARVSTLRESLTELGIGWTQLPYHRSPSALATAWDIWSGIRQARALVRSGGFGIIHARSYVAGLMALRAARATGARFLFDMRGFWADERVEGGIWPRSSPLFRIAKWVEKRLLRGADGIVVLSDAAVPHLAELAHGPVTDRIITVPTCVDLELFRPPATRAALRARLGLPEDAFVLIYTGSFGTWYLGAESMELADAVRRIVEFRGQEFRFVVLTREVDQVQALVPSTLRDDLVLNTVAHREVATWVGASDGAMALVRPSFSKTASCPTKLGEYLACGVPVVSTRGIGDVDALLVPEVGALLDDGTSEGLDHAAAQLLSLASRDTTTDACRHAAGFFSLDRGVGRMLELYQTLTPEAPLTDKADD